MKSKILMIFVALFLLFIAVGCGENNPPVVEKTTVVFVTYTEEKFEYKVADASEVDNLVIPEVTKEGFKFGGWYFDAQFKTEFSLDALKEKLNNATIKIYAQWDRIMEKGAIIVHGMVEDKVVINPVFEWDNSLGDSEFALLLVDDEDNTIVNFNVDTNRYELIKNLDYGKKYSLTVTGLDSNVVGSIEFETMTGNESVNLTNATISVCEPYKSYMVLQRRVENEVYGTTFANVLVMLEFHDEIYYTVSNANGEYKFVLPEMEADTSSSDFEIRILRNKKLTLTDVLVGDVYLVSGQSNVQWPLKDSDYQPTDVDKAMNADVRFFSMSTNTSTEPLDTTKNGKWFKVSKSDSGYKHYSAVAFMVGSMLGEALDSKHVPIGIICAAQGDTNIVNWMSKDYYNGSISTKNLHYNGMIYPLQHAKFTGVVWYQGCNNSAAGSAYKDLLLTLFANWRELFDNEELPFYIVQLPVYDGDDGNNYDFSYVRESQYLATREDDNAYLIASCDGGDPTFIHPTEKRYICERVTKSILSTIYGYDYAPESPTYNSHVVEGNKVIISVNNGEGLAAKGEIVGFKLAGADGKYYDASAKIENGKIVVTSTHVANPVYIKYGFSKSPFLNIYNKDGYLMSPFRTDTYNRNIDLLDYSDEPNYKLHQDGSKMEYKVVTVNGEVGTEIKKLADGKTFGSLQLDKWGAIGYNELGMKISVIGTNSGAKVSFRFVEGSYEIWAYSFVDDFVGKKEFEFATSELKCVYNKVDNVVDYQKVINIEVTVEAPGAATITVLEAKFIDVERTKPTNFIINEGKEDGSNYVISYSSAAFAESYHVIVSRDGINFTNPVYEVETDKTSVTFDVSSYEKGKPYYVKVVAKNELGETEAKNNGFVFTLKDENKLIINNFDYLDDESLQTYVNVNMKVHAGLSVALDPKGIKITSAGQGWQNFIFVVENGVNKGYNTLSFYMDVTDYQGSVVIQLVDASYNIFQLTLDTSTVKDGVFELPLDTFLKSGEKFDGRNLIWFSFNFSDSKGGTIYFDDLQLLK